MANNYYDATGVLVLQRVTPVITALFGSFELDPSYPGDGLAYIARISEANDPQWSDVLDGLVDLTAQLALPPFGDDPSIESVLESLARHFGAEHNTDLLHLIEHQQFEDSADLKALMVIAWCFNDGHNLAAIQFEGCWHCGKPRLFEFGGEGCFLSREIRLHGTSSEVLSLGAELRAAIVADDLEAASARIAKESLSLLSSVSDQSLHQRLCTRVAELLRENIAPPAD